MRRCRYDGNGITFSVNIMFPLDFFLICLDLQTVCIATRYISQKYPVFSGGRKGITVVSSKREFILKCRFRNCTTRNIIGCSAMRKIQATRMRYYARNKMRERSTSPSKIVQFQWKQMAVIGQKRFYPPYKKGPIFAIGDPRSRTLYSSHPLSLIFSLTVEEIDFLPPRGTTQSSRNSLVAFILTTPSRVGDCYRAMRAIQYVVFRFQS